MFSYFILNVYYFNFWVKSGVRIKNIKSLQDKVVLVEEKNHTFEYMVVYVEKHSWNVNNERMYCFIKDLENQETFILFNFRPWKLYPVQLYTLKTISCSTLDLENYILFNFRPWKLYPVQLLDLENNILFYLDLKNYILLYIRPGELYLVLF